MSDNVGKNELSDVVYRLWFSNDLVVFDLLVISGYVYEFWVDLPRFLKIF